MVTSHGDTDLQRKKMLTIMNDEKWNTMLQQFVTYVTKNFVKKVKILLKSNIIVIITQENIEY